MLSLEFLATTVVPVMALLFVGAIGFANLFHNVRKRFPIRVNCWFCNVNTRVPYESSNSWFCPSCTQYNGFTEDGDYNREIPAQYQSRLNPQANITDDDKISYSTPHNGLCFGCNRNQELKIHQLASFVPDVEEDYDEEVEEYKRELEQTYKLCSRCERVVKRTLNDVKRNILGSKLAQIGTKGLKVFDMHMKESEKQIAVRRLKTLANVCLAAISVILLMKIVQIVNQMDLSRKRLESVFGPEVLQAILVVVSYLVAVKDTLLAQWNGIMEQPTVVDSVNQLKCAKNVFSHYWSEKVDIPEAFADVLRENQDVTTVIPRHVLSNLALIGLSGMLLALRLHVGNLKPTIVIVCSVIEIVLKTDYVREVFNVEAHAESIWFLLASISLVAALGCIGKTAPKVKPSDDVNSSFHKIYSRQAIDADCSDTIDDSSSILQDASICSRQGYPTEKSPPAANNHSGKSMDTTKSISPSVLSASTLRPFLDTSFSSQIGSPRSHWGGSVLNVNRLNATFQEQSTRGSVCRPSPAVSVDNFTTAIAGPNESSLGYGFSKYGYSTACLNKSVLLEEDDRFGDDIDRLSISGHLSVSRRDLTMVNNPFSTHHVDRDDGFSLRHRKVTISPPQLGTVAESGSSWIAGGYWGGSPQKEDPHNATFTAQPYMSRTSSQSSGFESQPTRRPTPEEPPGVDLDRVSLFSEPVGAFPSSASSVSAFQRPTPRLNQSFHLPVPQSSPVPSSHASFFSRPSYHSTSGRSLFGESNLFQHHHASPQVPSLIFPPHHSYTPPVFNAHSAGSNNPALSSPSCLPGQMTPRNGIRRSLLNLSKLGGISEADGKPIQGE
nr:uncharacterized protein LOC115255629 isoform X1 [Aedes albopictus]